MYLLSFPGFWWKNPLKATNYWYHKKWSFGKLQITKLLNHNTSVQTNKQRIKTRFNLRVCSKVTKNGSIKSKIAFWTCCTNLIFLIQKESVHWSWKRMSTAAKMSSIHATTASTATFTSREPTTGMLRSFDSWRNGLSKILTVHSKLRQFSVKFQVPETKIIKGWSVCFKDSKIVLHGIIANRAWKGFAS